MNWKKVKMGELCEINTGKYDVNHSDKNGNFPFFTCALEPFRSFTFSFDDKAIILPGNGANVGEVLYYEGKFEAYQRTYVLSKFETDTKYVYYFFRKEWKQSQLQKQYGSATNYIRLDNITNLEIPIPSLPTQQRIAAILDEADMLRKADAEILGKYNDLLQSGFLQLFGNSEEMKRKYPSKKLYAVSDIVSGVAKNTKAYKADFIEVPYMRVANVQDGHITLSEIKTIKVSKQDFNKYLLQKNDILLTEGGDPDKLGRGAVWHDEISPCIHQNHIFRVRPNDEELDAGYLSHHIGSGYGKKYFLKAAKQTTGIASINMTQLKNFDVFVPPIRLQKQFAEITSFIEDQKFIVQQQQQQSESLFQSLLQRAFKGEL